MTDLRQGAATAAFFLAALAAWVGIVAVAVAGTGGDSFTDGLVAGTLATVVGASVLVSAGRGQR